MKRIALVTSGLGNKMGGIGYASELARDALLPLAKVSLWQNHHTWPLPARAMHLAARALFNAVQGLDFVFYEHVNLARIHAAIPAVRRIPYGILLCGAELWHPLSSAKRIAIERANVRISISQTTVDLARKENPWFPEARVVWLGIPTKSERQASLDEPIALVVGRMDASERRKGHDPILDAWRIIRDAVPSARLFVVGSGDDVGRLSARVEKERLDGVVFTGFISDAQRDALYLASRLFLFPSTQEGFGFAAVEAAALGVPVLGVRGTVMEELFPGDCGAVFASSQTGEAIAHTAIPVLSSRQRSQEVGDKARRRVSEVFRVEHFTKRFVEALDPFLRQK